MRPSVVVVIAAIAAAPGFAAGQSVDGAGDPAAPGRGLQVGVGIGTAKIVRAGGTADDAATTVRVRISAVRSRRVVVGLEGAFTSTGASQQRHLDATVAFFPWEKLLYVRGGLGASVVTTGFGQTEQGPNALVGIGLAPWRGGLSPTLNVDFHRYLDTPLGDRSSDGGGSLSAWIGLDW